MESHQLEACGFIDVTRIVAGSRHDQALEGNAQPEEKPHVLQGGLVVESFGADPDQDLKGWLVVLRVLASTVERILVQSKLKYRPPGYTIVLFDSALSEICFSMS